MSELKLNEIYATKVNLKNGKFYTVHHSIIKEETFKKFKALKENLLSTALSVEFVVCEVIPLKSAE